MMADVIEVELARQVERLRVLWPQLRKSSGITDEVEAAVMRHARRITADDVRLGFDDVVEGSPSTGWPPGPHEVVGCILAASKSRKRSTDGHEPERELPRIEVVGRQCPACGKALELMPPERVIMCTACGTLQPVHGSGGNYDAPRYHLTWAEVQDISTRNVGTPGTSDDAAATITRMRKRRTSPAADPDADAASAVMVRDIQRDTSSDTIEWGTT